MSGAMEAAGALKVVKRALDKSNLRYVSCIGDPYISMKLTTANLIMTSKS